METNEEWCSKLSELESIIDERRNTEDIICIFVGLEIANIELGRLPDKNGGSASTGRSFLDTISRYATPVDGDAVAAAPAPAVTTAFNATPIIDKLFSSGARNGIRCVTEVSVYRQFSKILMELSYDKAALQEYMDDIGSVGESLRRAKDESFSLYNSCKQQYTRLYTELEQANRKAYNMVESAESMQRAADAEYELAMRRLENAEDDSERESAQEQLRSAQAHQAEAAHEMSIASAAYATAQENMKKLTDVWERYQPSIDSAAHKVEDGLSSFSTLASNGNSDLGEYMGIMDKAQAALYDGATGASSSGSGSSLSSTSNSTVGQSKSSTFRSKAGNTLGLVTAAEVASIVMNIAGKEHSFPHTKSGGSKGVSYCCKEWRFGNDCTYEWYVLLFWFFKGWYSTKSTVCCRCTF